MVRNQTVFLILKMSREGDLFVVNLVRLDENGNDVRVHLLEEGNTVFGRGHKYSIRFHHFF